jgi:hypothetical protein
MAVEPVEDHAVELAASGDQPLDEAHAVATSDAFRMERDHHRESPRRTPSEMASWSTVIATVRRGSTSGTA